MCLLVTSFPFASPWPVRVRSGAGCGFAPLPAASLESHTHTLPSRPAEATSPPGSARSESTPLTRLTLPCAARTAHGTASPCSGGSLGQTRTMLSIAPVSSVAPSPP